MKKTSVCRCVLCSFILTWLPVSVAWADGGYFSRQSVAVTADQRAILIKNGSRISMTLSTGYTGEGEDFGWIIPIPVSPAARNVSEAGENGEAAFRILDEYSAPVFTIYSYRGGGCFPAETDVLTAGGPRPIEAVEAGTEVFACDLATGEWVLRRVLQRLSHEYVGDVITIQIGSITIQATGNHPFLVVRGVRLASRPVPRDIPGEEHGVTERGRWVEARDLKEGDVLRDKGSDGLTITSLSSSDKKMEVYNLSVEGCHNYAIHQKGILVHNKGGGEVRGAPEPLVRQYRKVTLRHYEVSILGAASGSALLNWLQKNGYQVNPAAREVVDAYVERRWAFVAVKLNPSEKRHYENEFLPPLTIQYRSDRLIFPVRMSSVSTIQTTRITLYVISENTVSSPNFPTTVLGYDQSPSRPVAPESYIEAAIRKTTGSSKRGLVVTWSGKMAMSDGQEKILRRLMKTSFPKGYLSFLTRLETRIDPSAMTEDIEFTRDPSPRNFQVMVNARAGSVGSVDGTGIAARFNNPTGVTTDGANLYLADTGNNTIRRLAVATGAVTTIAGSAGQHGFADGTGSAARFGDPGGIATDGTSLYVTDVYNSTIRKIEIVTGAVTTIAGSAKQTGFADGTGRAARFDHPGGIATDGTFLYVTDVYNSTIRKIEVATGAVTTIAGSAKQTGSADGRGSAARFDHPDGVTTDGRNLYITDTDNQTIRKLVVATGVVTTIAGRAGQAGFVDGRRTGARFRYPSGITTDGRNLYVADLINNCIRKVAIATGAVSSIAGCGTGSVPAGVVTARLLGPQGITTDGTNLYFTDADSNEIVGVVLVTGAVTTIAGGAQDSPVEYVE